MRRSSTSGLVVLCAVLVAALALASPAAAKHKRSGHGSLSIELYGMSRLLRGFNVGNEELVRDVYDELPRTRPGGLRYATFRLPDGVSFLHLAETEDRTNPLGGDRGVPRVSEEHRRPLRGRAGRHPAPPDGLVRPREGRLDLSWCTVF